MVVDPDPLLLFKRSNHCYQFFEGWCRFSDAVGDGEEGDGRVLPIHRSRRMQDGVDEGVMVFDRAAVFATLNANEVLTEVTLSGDGDQLRAVVNVAVVSLEDPGELHDRDDSVAVLMAERGIVVVFEVPVFHTQVKHLLHRRH